MRLQQKTILIFIFLLIVLMTLVSVFSSIVILSSYSDLEQQYTAKDLQQAVSRIDDETNTLSAIVSDWGPWDDTYFFVQGNKPDFVQANLIPDTFNNLRLNVILIVNRNGDIRYAGAYNSSSGTMVPVPEDLLAQIDRKSPLMDLSDPRRETRGILLLSENPLIVASRPIVRTDFSGEPMGVVIMGRYLDSSEVERLAQLTRPSLAFYQLNDPALPAGVVETFEGKNPPANGIVRPLDSNSIAGYALIRDIYGNDALILSISDPRSIYQQGLTTTLRFILIILVSGLLFGLVVMVLLDRLVLSRLEKLISQVHAVGTDSSGPGHLNIGGDDEFSGLAREITRMLETIDTTRQKVQISETRFRELAGLLPQVIFEMDTEGNLQYVNKAGTEQFGITRRMIEDGINIRRFLPPDNIEQMKRGLAAVLAGSPSPGEVYSLIRPDGSVMKAIASTSLIKKDGTVTGFRGIVVDVTEHVNLEQALTESQEYLQTLFSSVKAGILVIDARTHRIIDANPAALEMIGTTRDQVVNQVCHRFICPAEEGSCPITDLKQRVDNAERVLLTARGDTLSIIKYVVPVTLHGKACLLETFMDNSYRKQIEQQLKESEEKYRTLTENTPDILFSTDLTGRVTYISPQINQYGFLADEITGHPIFDLLHPEDRARVADNFVRELSEGAQLSVTFRILDKWGSPYWFEDRSFLQLDEFGGQKAILGMMRDITERRRAEDAIELANKKLNLMNNITRHDILNTITGLLGCVDMAQATTSVEERAQLLNDIRELTRVIQRQINFTKDYQEVGVHLPRWQVVGDVIGGVLVNFENSPVHFEVTLERTEIYADPLLEKVFYNLVDNAIRYGKTVTRIKFYFLISDKGLSLICEDDGVGIAEKDKHFIFERGVGQNTGMGLFLSREILSITGIEIQENGIAGSGARFEILIPRGAFRFRH